MAKSPTKNTYAVPRRFGIGAILAFTTLFALVLGVVKRFDSPLWVYWYLGVLGAAVCVAQMFATRAPRAISVITGAACLPLFLVIALWRQIERGYVGLFELLIGFPLAVVVGGFVGYLAGALAAGVFLLGSLLEARLRGEVSPSKKDPEVPEEVPYYDEDSCSPYLGSAAAQLNSVMNNTPSTPRVKSLGPPVGVPVYNCIALVSPRNADGVVCVRAANLSDLKTTGASEREALQHLVGAFKIIVSQAVAEGRPVPLLAEQHPALPGEQQRFIAVHL